MLWLIYFYHNTGKRELLRCSFASLDSQLSFRNNKFPCFAENIELNMLSNHHL